MYCKSQAMSASSSTTRTVLFFVCTRSSNVSGWQSDRHLEHALQPRLSAAVHWLAMSRCCHDRRISVSLSETAPRRAAMVERLGHRGRRIVAALTGLLSLCALALPASAQNRPTVAVMPFENASGDAAQDYFSDGLTD